MSLDGKVIELSQTFPSEAQNSQSNLDALTDSMKAFADAQNEEDDKDTSLLFVKEDETENVDITPKRKNFSFSDSQATIATSLLIVMILILGTITLLLCILVLVQQKRNKPIMLHGQPVITPEPKSCVIISGWFVIKSKLMILIPEDSFVAEDAALRIKTMLNNTIDINVHIQKGTISQSAKNPEIQFIKKNDGMNSEEYSVVVTEQHILITGCTEAALHHGFVTLLQMFPPDIVGAAFLDMKDEYGSTTNKSKETATTNDSHAARTLSSKLNGLFGLKDGTWHKSGKRIPSGTVSLQCVEIHDEPQYKYRGFLLDVARHLSTVSEVKKMIELIAFHKMNVFHLHLTDDQGWRLFIPKYPKLTEIGAWRQNTRANFAERERTEDLKLHERNDLDYGVESSITKQSTEVHSSMKSATFEDIDSDPEWGFTRDSTNLAVPFGVYGGFFTHEDIREIVSFASKRGVVVQPEIDMPGHAMAALASYPSLGCKEMKWKVTGRWGIFQAVLCSKEEVMTFLEDVMEEVFSLFNSQFVHIGGDECVEDMWRKCSACAAQMKKAGLSYASQIPCLFLNRMEKAAASAGKRIIGWDEITECKNRKNDTAAIVWHPSGDAESIALKGTEVVISPMSFCYLDFNETRSGERCNNESDYSNDMNQISLHTQQHSFDSIDSSLPVPFSLSANGAIHSERLSNYYNASLANAYSFDPLYFVSPRIFRKKELSPAEQQDAEILRKNVIGGQCNLWTEHLPTQDKREFNTLPRLAAIAEALWIQREKKDWNIFLDKMKKHLTRVYKSMNWKFNNMNL